MTNDDVSSWRHRAAEARRVAETLKSPEARAHMIECANAYERLAVLAEKTTPTRSG